MFKKKQVLTIASIVVISFLIGTTFNVMAMATDGGNPFDKIWEAIYDLQARVTALEEISNTKTWHFVMNFTTNETSKTSPNFFIQGQQWRIRWKLIGVEKPFPELNLEQATLVEWVRETGWKREWAGLMVYDDSRFLMSILDIPMTQISYFANRYGAGYIGDVGFMAFDDDPDIKGIQYVFHGEGVFHIEIRGMLTPVTLTVESYH